LVECWSGIGEEKGVYGRWGLMVKEEEKAKEVKSNMSQESSNR